MDEEKKEFRAIINQLQAAVDRYDELNELISDPQIIKDSRKFAKLSKEDGELRGLVTEFAHYKKLTKAIAGDKEMLGENLGNEMKALTKDEITKLSGQRAKSIHKLRLMLIPKDPNDNKNIIMEIHAAAGGDEGGLFAADLFNMYTRYAESQGWKVQVIDKHENEVGGFNEIVLMITGKNVYSKLKFENGAHRVQRIPKTESSGRIQTSTATVGVMPEEPNLKIKINPKDIRTDVFRASGAGGQHVNKTQSAVRMTYLPANIVVSIQDQRSQQQNRIKAMEVLKSRVYHYYKEKENKKYDEKRKSAVGSGARAERIRTYNYPQNRVTDHRINLTINKLDKVMNGDLEGIIDALIMSDQAKKLENLTK